MFTEVYDVGRLLEMEFNITAICSLPTSELLLQLHSSTYLPATGGGFPLHCCKVPTSNLEDSRPTGKKRFLDPH